MNINIIDTIIDISIISSPFKLIQLKFIDIII